MPCLLLPQSIVFCKSSLLCMLWALLGHGARIAHQERSLTTNLNAANNYKAASCFWGWGWSQEQDGFFGGWIHGFCNGFVLLVFLPFFSWDFSPSFTWTDTMAVSTVQPTKLMGGSISSPKKHDQWGAQPHRWFQADHLKANMATLSAAKIVYSAGFFITVSPESMEMLGVPKAQIRPTVVGGLSRQAPDRVMGETAPMVLMVEKIWLLIG